MNSSLRLPSGATRLVLLGAALLISTVHAGATDHLSALALRTAVIAGLWFAWPRSPIGFRGGHLAIPAAALTLVVVALPFGQSLGPALQALLRVSFVVIVFLLALAVPHSARERVLLVALAVAAVHAVWAAAQWFQGVATRGSGGFFNPNDLAACLAPLFVIAVARTAGARNRARWLAAALAATLLLGLYATSSRSGLLAAMLGAGVLVGTGRARRWALVALLVLVGAVITTPSLRDRFLGLDDPYAFSRVRIWEQAARVALRSPLGVGLGGFEPAMRQHGVALDTPVRYPKLAANAHSELVYAWVELGWFGLVIASLPAALVLVILWRRRNADPEVGRDTGVLIAFAVPALVSTSLHVPPVAYLAAWWAGDVVARDPKVGWKIRLRYGRAVLVAFGLALLATAVPGAVAHASLQRAAALRDNGQLDAALQWAERAARMTPWSAGAAVMVESLRFARGDPPLEVAERLMGIAETHPTRVEPVQRAAALLDALAQKTGEDAVWALAAAVRERQLERDPFNALAWVALGRARQDDSTATAAFERAVEVEPRCARALAHLAAHAARSGNHERAVKLARAAHAANEVAPSYRGYPHHVLSLDRLSRIMLSSVSRSP